MVRVQFMDIQICPGSGEQPGRAFMSGTCCAFLEGLGVKGLSLALGCRGVEQKSGGVTAFGSKTHSPII